MGVFIYEIYLISTMVTTVVMRRFWGDSKNKSCLNPMSNQSCLSSSAKFLNNIQCMCATHHRKKPHRLNVFASKLYQGKKLEIQLKSLPRVDPQAEAGRQKRGFSRGSV